MMDKDIAVAEDMAEAEVEADMAGSDRELN